MNSRMAGRARYASMPQGDRWKKAIDANDTKFVFRALKESGILQNQVINDSGRIRIGEHDKALVRKYTSLALYAAGFYPKNPEDKKSRAEIHKMMQAEFEARYNARDTSAIISEIESKIRELKVEIAARNFGRAINLHRKAALQALKEHITHPKRIPEDLKI